MTKKKLQTLPKGLLGKAVAYTLPESVVSPSAVALVFLTGIWLWLNMALASVVFPGCLAPVIVTIGKLRNINGIVLSASRVIMI